MPSTFSKLAADRALIEGSSLLLAFLELPRRLTGFDLRVHQVEVATSGAR